MSDSIIRSLSSSFFYDPNIITNIEKMFSFEFKRQGKKDWRNWMKWVSRKLFLSKEKCNYLFYFQGSLSSVEKSGRFVVVKSAEVSDSNDNGNFLQFNI